MVGGVGFKVERATGGVGEGCEKGGVGEVVFEKRGVADGECVGSEVDGIGG